MVSFTHSQATMRISMLLFVYLLLLTVVPVATALDTNWNVTTLAGNSSLNTGYVDGNGITAKFNLPAILSIIGGNTIVVGDQCMELIVYNL